MIATWLGGTTSDGDWFEALLRYGADGGGPVDAFPGIQTRSGACPSVDGSRATVWAEVEVPNEAPLYLMDVGGSAPPRLLTERGGVVMCPNPAGRDRHPPDRDGALGHGAVDLVTGDETTLADDIPVGLYPTSCLTAGSSPSRRAREAPP